MRVIILALFAANALANPPDVKEAISHVEMKFVADTRIQQELREAPLPQIPEKALNQDGIKRGVEIRREGQSIIIKGEDRVR